LWRHSRPELITERRAEGHSEELSKRSIKKETRRERLRQEKENNKDLRGLKRKLIS
jgi:hypothetical protein